MGLFDIVKKVKCLKMTILRISNWKNRFANGRRGHDPLRFPFEVQASLCREI